MYKFSIAEIHQKYQELIDKEEELEGNGSYHEGIAILKAYIAHLGTKDFGEDTFETTQIFREIRESMKLIADLNREQRLEKHRQYQRSKKLSLEDLKETITGIYSLITKYIPPDNIPSFTAEAQLLLSTLGTKAK